MPWPGSPHGSSRGPSLQGSFEVSPGVPWVHGALEVLQDERGRGARSLTGWALTRGGLMAPSGTGVRPPRPPSRGPGHRTMWSYGWAFRGVTVPSGVGHRMGWGTIFPPSIARGVPLESSMNGVTWGLQRVSWARAEQGIPVGSDSPLNLWGSRAGTQIHAPQVHGPSWVGGWSIIRMGVPSVGGPSGPHGTGSRGPSRPLIRATWTGSSGGSGSSYGARASYPWTGTPPRGGPPSSIGSLTDPSEGEDRTRAIMGLSGPHGSSDGRSNGPPRARVEVVGPWGPGRRSSFQTGGNPSRFLLHSSLGPEGRRSDGPPQRGTEGAARRARPLWAPATDWACLRPRAARVSVSLASLASPASLITSHHLLSSLIVSRVPYRLLSSLIVPRHLSSLSSRPQPPHSSRGSPWPLSCPPMDPHALSCHLMAPHAPLTPLESPRGPPSQASPLPPSALPTPAHTPPHPSTTSGSPLPHPSDSSPQPPGLQILLD
ncbi:hypothetical protein GMRT_24410 [Giardia muris]|uniref:Uncharacterized protein n=1 Tax=Giardia muris TaxID=5742 RepID=A0A4Z1SUU5_GIAMU|nr:hypothetical protein GMRT_24410 [Giardia muris]|eukprot:TNJ27378.1 hypothetical protein GMRT_24410 [Giardia muris]